MSEIAGILFFVVFGSFSYFGLRMIGRKRAKTEEEFERSVSEGSSGLAAAVKSLQGSIDPASERAERVVASLREGVYRKKADAGDDPESGKSGRTGN